MAGHDRAGLVGAAGEACKRLADEGEGAVGLSGTCGRRRAPGDGGGGGVGCVGRGIAWATRGNPSRHFLVLLVVPARGQNIKTRWWFQSLHVLVGFAYHMAFLSISLPLSFSLFLLPLHRQARTRVAIGGLVPRLLPGTICADDLFFDS
jgi:hypothetical protein